MKIIYRVIDRHTGEIRFESENLNECYQYVSDNCCTFSTIIRKKTIQ